MGGVGLGAVLPGHAVAPGLAEQGGQLAGGHAVAVVGTHVVPTGEGRVLILLLGDHQVGHHRLQHVLIGPGGVWVADDNGLLVRRRTDAVRDDAVPGEVAAADDIARPGRGNGGPSVLEKAALVAVGHQLRAGLGVGVGVVAVQRLVLPITPGPLLILIHFIRGHVQKGLDAGMGPHALQNVDRTHNVGLVGIDRLLIAGPHDGLGGQV